MSYDRDVATPYPCNVCGHATGHMPWCSMVQPARREARPQEERDPQRALVLEVRRVADAAERIAAGLDLLNAAVVAEPMLGMLRALFPKTFPKKGTAAK